MALRHRIAIGLSSCTDPVLALVFALVRSWGKPAKCRSPIQLGLESLPLAFFCKAFDMLIVVGPLWKIRTTDIQLFFGFRSAHEKRWWGLEEETRRGRDA